MRCIVSLATGFYFAASLNANLLFYCGKLVEFFLKLILHHGLMNIVLDGVVITFWPSDYRGHLRDIASIYFDRKNDSVSSID